MSEQETNIPPDQVALLLCQELEPCIRSYLPSENQSEEVDQQEVEQIQVEPKVDQARDELALQLFNRSLALLDQQGFGGVVTKALTDNRNYYNNLLIRSQTTQFLDTRLSLPGAKETTDFIRGIFDELLHQLHQEPVESPDPKDYRAHFPPPYDELFAGMFCIDILFNKARYVQMRDTIRQMLEGNSADR